MDISGQDNLAVKADKIAAAYRRNVQSALDGRYCGTQRLGYGLMTWDETREHCDVVTGGELDTVQLDILTDMVVERLKRLLTEAVA